MTTSRILIVEDDVRVVNGLVRGLRKAGFELGLATTGDEGLKRMLAESFELVLLDLRLPHTTGFEILERVRAKLSIPIVVLSAQTDLASRLRSFEHGAIDYVPKPFFVEELVARIRARLALFPESRKLAIGDVLLDLDGRWVSHDGIDLGLTAHEFNVLACLRERPGRTFTRLQLASSALPEGGERIDRTLDSYISRIRKKLGPTAGRCIQTVWGIGYRCVLEPT